MLPRRELRERNDMTEFQTRIHEAFQQAQTRAASRAREFEQEARKVLETLGDRAQAELRTLLQNAAKGSREQIAALGAELEKLGKKLQDIAARSAVKAEANGAAKPDDPPAPN
jgi:phytoene/squalene synthetase